MKSFYAPYNFVPAIGIRTSEQLNTTAETPRHDYWQAGTFSGRIYCRLTTTSHLVVGARQHRATETESADVIPFKLAGKPAIPGSSLRGMIGSLIETLSQSSLRILQERQFSVRKPAKPPHPLSAVGRLYLDSQGEIRLQPLTLPILALRNGFSEFKDGWLRAFALDRDPSKFRQATRISKLLPAYVHGYQGARNAPRELQPGSFLGRFPALNSSVRDTPPHSAILDIPLIRWDSDQRRIRAAGSGSRNLLLSRFIDTPAQNSTTEFQRVPTPGHFKILGISGRESQMPEGKKHELFIPLTDANLSLPMLPIDQAALKNLEFLLKEARTRESLLPFRNKGCQGLDIRQHAEEGQLIFFDVDESGKMVTELSYSGIWRRLASQTLYQAFEQITGDKRLLPYNPYRSVLTPAERLLGVVSTDDPDHKTDTRNRPQALASRVGFSHAQSPADTKAELAEPRLLQVLGSPKPPSPSMYFAQQNHKPLSKMDYAIGEHKPKPNGRKFYLPHPQSQRTWQNAETQSSNDDRNHLKMRVRAIKPETSFDFQIQVDNLSSAEMGLLLRALHPCTEFEHRLGLAKSLGLGHVKIQVQAIARVDRKLRYSMDGWNTLRYGEIWKNPAVAIPIELSTPAQAAVQVHELDANDPAASWDQSLVDPSTLAIVQTLGQAGNLDPDIPVCSPRTSRQLTGIRVEKDLFEWFSENDRDDNPQYLEPVVPGKPLPTLQARPPKKKMSS